MKIEKNSSDGIDLDINQEYEEMKTKINQMLIEGEIKILSQGNISDQDFEKLFNIEYDKYHKELKKCLRKAYINAFNPYKTLMGLEFIWLKYITIGVLDQDYVNSQRDRMYNSMKYPDIDIKNKVENLKQKIIKKFK